MSEAKEVERIESLEKKVAHLNEKTSCIARALIILISYSQLQLGEEKAQAILDELDY